MIQKGYISDPQNTFVTDAEIYRDGGTILVNLEDSAGRHFYCFFDGILRLTPGRLYTNGKSTNDAKAKLVLFNHIDQTIILEILQRHLDQNLTREEQDSFNENHGVINGIHDNFCRQLYLIWIPINRLQELTEEYNQTHNLPT